MSSEPGRRAVALCVLLAAVLTLPGLGARDLWAPDEPRYAQVAQEMLRDGTWWHPHVNSRPYDDKPHLYFWLAAASGAPGGAVSEGAARLPSALAHLALVAMTAFLAHRLSGSRAAAVVAALALATTWLEAWMSRRACLDVLLSACAMACIASMLLAGDAARAGGRGRLLAWSALAGIAAALGIMTKGPVVLLAIAAAGLPLLFLRGAREGRPQGTVPRGLAAAIVSAALALAAWLVPARVLGGWDPLAVTKEHVVERAAEGLHHEQPAWYFLTSVPADFMPWTLVAIPAFAWAWTRRREPAIAMLLGWALLPLVAHSIIVEKRNIYALPVLPAWALLIGLFVASLPQATRALRRAVAASALLLGVLGLAALVSPLAGSRSRDLAEILVLPRVGALLAVVGACALAGSAAMAWSLWRKATPMRLAATLALAHGLTLAALGVLLPRLDSLKSGRALGEVIARETAGAPIAMYPRTWDAYVYYSGRSITDMGREGEARAWLGSAGRPAYVLAYEKDLDELPLDGAAPPRSVHSDEVGHRRVHLLRYDAPPESR